MSRSSPETSNFVQTSVLQAADAHPSSNPPQSVTISACIVCRNEADKLGPCLESVAWVDEILVMDLSSSDDSATIARQHGARVVEHTPYPIVEPLRNELAAIAHGEWILALDPDERVTPGLAQELRRLAQRTDIDAVVIPRMNFDLGYAPSHPIQRYEPQLRMYRKARVVWPDIPNQLPNVPPARKFSVAQLDALALIHDRSRNVPEILERVIRYAPAQARSMIDQGQVFTAKAMLAAIVAQIDKEFFRAQAWKDGVPGLMRAAILVGYKFHVWIAFWQLSGSPKTSADDRLIWRIGWTLDVARRTLGQIARWSNVIIRRLPSRTHRT